MSTLVGSLRRVKNKAIARTVTRIPSLSRFIIESFTPVETGGVPWTPLLKLLSQSKVALVTTAGVHHRDQQPFDMDDKDGDPSYRIIDSARPVDTLTITHDYYDHSDADKDINIVFPIERLKELKEQGIIGSVSDVHVGFMGHIVGKHIETLVDKTSREAAEKLKAEGVDVALLTPG